MTGCALRFGTSVSMRKPGSLVFACLSLGVQAGAFAAFVWLFFGAGWFLLGG